MTALTPYAVREVSDNRRAIIFVHGFSGNAHSTFGMMPAFLAGDPRLFGWDIWSFGYSSGLCPDITGLWSSDPNISNLSGLLRENLAFRWQRYEKVSLIAHSMGGLVVQRALLDADLQDRVHSCLLFGTPSLGLKKAGFGRWLKQQAADMSDGSTFIKKLREDWSAKFGNPPFAFSAIAGQNDQFVPPRSSIELFEPKYRGYVAGNHLEMVKPLSRDTDSVLRVIGQLTGTTIPLPAPKPATKPADRISQQALALELAGLEDQAVQLLEDNLGVGTDVQGTLAGRYKRRWLRDLDNGAPDAARAEKLYASAYAQASAASDHQQAAYNGINAAFMMLARSDDQVGAARQAELVLGHVEQDLSNPWGLATQAEALLHLRRPAEALATYKQAVESLDARGRGSMFQQASWTARLLGETLVDVHLEALMHQTM